MRHRKKTVKLGRTSAHREILLANLVCSLITEKRIKTTLPKAKAASSLADKMVTLGKKGDLAARRRAISKLRQKACVAELFDRIAPEYSTRQGGYTRILKLGKRYSDSAEMAILEWVKFEFEANVESETIETAEEILSEPVEEKEPDKAEEVEAEPVTEETPETVKPEKKKRRWFR